jgi:poly(beta-D-mannuronate) lyase
MSSKKLVKVLALVTVLMFMFANLTYAAGVTVKADQTPQKQYVAKNTIDGKLTDESRWSAESTWRTITYDLGSVKSVGSVDIAWAFVKNQQTTYDIAVSVDGKTYTTVVVAATCKPVEGFQNNAFKFATKARFVKVIGHFNSSGEWGQWISIQEVKINAK